MSAPWRADAAAMRTRMRTVAAMCIATGVFGCGGGNDYLAVETFRNPPELRASAGALHASLTVAPQTVKVDGIDVATTLYNGLYIPPVLRLSPGDTLFLELNNQSTQPTNEHYHGLNVVPGLNADGTVSDSVFVHVQPSTKLNYEVAIPADHHPGLYWYHSHQHGMAEAQVMGGLSGGLIIEGLMDPLPQFAGIKERVMLLKDIQIGPDGKVPVDIDSSAPTHRTVNGQTNPVLTIAPGETQLLRIANVGANMYYHLSMQGYTLYEIARDGIRHNRPVPFTDMLLPPASRSEILIQGGARGATTMQSLAISTGPQGDTAPPTVLFTLVSQGDGVAPIPIPAALPAIDDLRTLPAARKRTITFDESADGNTFYIDSGAGPVQFDPNRIDSTIQSGTVEEWTILNPTGEWHVFHIHQTDFQVTEVNGVVQPFTGHQDNVNVDFEQPGTATPGQVKMLIDFRDPIIIGKFVYHCHIMEHEDGGMMAVAEVVPASTAMPSAASGYVKSAMAATAGMFQRVLASNDAGKAAVTDKERRTEETLSAVQAGSYCKADRPRGAVRRPSVARPAPVSTPATSRPAPIDGRTLASANFLLEPVKSMR